MIMRRGEEKGCLRAHWRTSLRRGAWLGSQLEQGHTFLLTTHLIRNIFRRRVERLKPSQKSPVKIKLCD
jgi:hypothetical protein